MTLNVSLTTFKVNVEKTYTASDVPHRQRD